MTDRIRCAWIFRKTKCRAATADRKAMIIAIPSSTAPNGWIWNRSGNSSRKHWSSGKSESCLNLKWGSRVGEAPYASRMHYLQRLPFVVLLLATSIGFAAENPKWQIEWQKTIEGAKKEGQLSLYGGQEITHPDIIAAFNKEFPFIKVITVAGRGGDLMARITAERRADKYLADLIASGPNGPRMLYLGKALDPIAPAFILPEVTDTSKWYGGKHWYADLENQFIFIYEGTIISTGLSYNSKLTNAEEIKSYGDLLRPKWKGRLLTLDPRGAVPPTQVLMLYHTAGLGPDFVRRFYTETDITLFRDRRQGTNWLATGKFPICFLCRDIEKVKEQGLPVDVIPADWIKEGGTLGGGSASNLALINR